MPLGEVAQNRSDKFFGIISKPNAVTPDIGYTTFIMFRSGQQIDTFYATLTTGQY